MRHRKSRRPASFVPLLNGSGIGEFFGSFSQLRFWGIQTINRHTLPHSSPMLLSALFFPDIETGRQARVDFSRSSPGKWTRPCRRLACSCDLGFGVAAYDIDSDCSVKAAASNAEGGNNVVVFSVSSVLSFSCPPVARFADFGAPPMIFWSRGSLVFCCLVLLFVYQM